MGVDLTLIPASHGSFEGPETVYVLGHTILHLDRDYDLWDRIKAIPSETFPKDTFSSYFAEREDGENEYGYCNQDPYGNRLLWVQAGQLADVMKEYIQKEYRPDDGPNNQAATAFLAAFPPQKPVVLYWH
jgi:hypothetical protein